MGETLLSEKKKNILAGRARQKKSGTPHVPNWVTKRGGASFLGKNREGGASISGEKEWWGFKLLRSLKPQSSIFIPNVFDRRVSPLVFPRMGELLEPARQSHRGAPPLCKMVELLFFYAGQNWHPASIIYIFLLYPNVSILTPAEHIDNGLRHCDSIIGNRIK